MKFQTLSLVAGSEACNAKCDFCVARMTPDNGMNRKHVPLVLDNLDIACRLAEKGGVTSALITGKGEPTLFPEDITAYLKVIPEYFPLIELQTNAMTFSLPNSRRRMRKYLSRWRKMGLTTISISIVHFLDDLNQVIYCNDGDKHRFPYPPLAETIELLKSYGYSIRLGCIGIRGYIDSAYLLAQLLEFAKKHQVSQVTWRPVATPDKARNTEVYRRATELSLAHSSIEAISDWAKLYGKKLLNLLHAEVYDIGGQNLCLSNCLTIDPDYDTIRQLIYWPDGHIGYDWQYEGAIIL